MKITKEELANIIKEEVEKALGEEAESDKEMEASIWYDIDPSKPNIVRKECLKIYLQEKVLK